MGFRQLFLPGHDARVFHPYSDRAAGEKRRAEGARMDFELCEEHRMLADLAGRFVDDELMPLEAAVLAREAAGEGLGIGEAERLRIDAVSRKLSLWGAPSPPTPCRPTPPICGC